MKKPTYHFSSSASNQKLRSLFLDNPALIGELIDAAICNGIAGDLYNLRKAAGLTQRQLAEMLQVKQSNISRWETPGYQGYKVKVLSKIARTLGGKLSVSIAPQNTYTRTLRFVDSIVVQHAPPGVTDRGSTPTLWSSLNKYHIENKEYYNYASN